MSISMNSQSALHEVESRCTQERPPRCQSLCPLGLDARAFLGHAAEGRWSDARKQLERYLPLPGLLARVCDHPCEQGCLRGDLGGAHPGAGRDHDVADPIRFLREREIVHFQRFGEPKQLT